MARLCSQCKYYTTDAESVCPRCNLALQVTFLPPPGQAAAPPDNGGRGPSFCTGPAAPA